eukprot:g1725.t1
MSEKKKNITIPKSIKAKWEEIQATDNGLAWMLCTVEGGLKKSLKLFKTGTGGHPHFQEFITDTAILFGGFKTTVYEEKGDATSVTDKFIFFLYSGENVPSFKKAQIVPTFTEVSTCFGNCVLRQIFEGKEDFSTESMEKKLANLDRGEAKYDWTNGKAVGTLDIPEKSSPPKPPQDKSLKRTPTKEEADDDDGDDEPMNIRVRLPTKQTAKLEVPPSTTVAALKKIINANHYKALGPEQMKLTYHKKKMKDDQSLRSAGVEENGLIYLKGPFVVVVEMPDKKTIFVLSKSSQTSNDVRTSICKTQSLGDPKNVALFFRGKMLISTKTLKEQHIFSGDKLTCTVRAETRVSFLVSTYGDAHGSNQNMAKIILDGFQVRYELVDGALPEYKDRRNELFAISGKRGVYPQLFIDDKYIGSHAEIEDLNETGELQTLLGPIQADPSQKATKGPKSGRFDW